MSDVYEIREDGIYLTGTVYYGFGAGVPTGLEDGERLSYGENGEMIITGMDTKIPQLIYIVGTVSDHVLSIGGEDISLRGLCGQNTKVQLTVIRGIF